MLWKTPLQPLFRYTSPAGEEPVGSRSHTPLQKCAPFTWDPGIPAQTASPKTRKFLSFRFINFPPTTGNKVKSHQSGDGRDKTWTSPLKYHMCASKIPPCRRESVVERESGWPVDHRSDIPIWLAKNSDKSKSSKFKPVFQMLLKVHLSGRKDRLYCI